MNSPIVENEVLIGHDGYLYLAGGTHRVLDVITGKFPVPKASYGRFEANLKQRKKWAASRGAAYHHVICPDKQSVVRKAFPIPAVLNLGEEYLRRCQADADSLVYLADVLRPHEDICFQRTDTHLTDRGAVISAAHIASMLTGKNCQEHANKLSSMITDEQTISGDLGSKLSPKRSSPEIFLDGDWGARLFSNNLSQGNNGIVDIRMSPRAIDSRRLLMFGDSFGRVLMRMLSYFFSECIFLRTPYFHVDILNQIQPDFVLTENAERYLTFIPSDQERPSFHMYPYLREGGQSSGPDQKFAEAFSAVLNYPRKPYKKFKAKMSEAAG